MRRSTRRPAVPVLLGLLLLIAAARSPAQDQAEPPVFDSRVSIVSVPVFVVDRDGRAMRGLQPEDFVLYEDKERAEIVSFQYVDTTSPEAQEEIMQASPARRRFLFFFDLSFTDPSGLVRARKAAQDIVQNSLAPSDLAAVATFDFNQGVRVVANFTDDRALVWRAIQTLGVPRLAKVSDPLALVSGIEATDLATGGQDQASLAADPFLIDTLSVQARQLRQADENIYRDQVRFLLDSMEDFATALNTVEGRKQVIYFSAGFDSGGLVGATAADMRSAAESFVQGRLFNVDDQARFGDPRLRNQLKDVTRLFSDTDSVVHTIDVTGLGSDNSLEQTQYTREITRQTRGREALFSIASQTGGRFFKDTNDLRGALGEVLDMTSRYYILGYEAKHETGPGSYHKLKVQVARKGAKVSHRAGYFERTPRSGQSILQRQFESAQLVVTGSGYTDLEFEALCLPFPEAGEKQTLGVVLQVPRGQFAWDQPVALDVYGYAVAGSGLYVDHISQFVRVDPRVADPEGNADGIAFYGTLRVPPGEYSLRFLVQNADSGTAGVRFIDVQVPPYDAHQGFLLPPVVVDDPTRWLGVVFDDARRRGDFPFLIGGEPFLPRTTFSVTPGRAERLVLIAYDPEGTPDDKVSDLVIRSSLTDGDGLPVAGGRLAIQSIERGPEGKRTYLLEFVPDDVEPGDYTMRIGLGEGGLNIEAYTRIKVGL